MYSAGSTNKVNMVEVTSPPTTTDFDEAFARLVSESYTMTNFDEITKNLENNKEFYDLVFQAIMDGEQKTFNIDNPVISKGVVLGILSDSPGNVAVHNNFYTQRIYNYMASKIDTKIEARANLLQ